MPGLCRVSSRTQVLLARYVHHQSTLQGRYDSHADQLHGAGHPRGSIEASPPLESGFRGCGGGLDCRRPLDAVLNETAGNVDMGGQLRDNTLWFQPGDMSVRDAIECLESKHGVSASIEYRVAGFSAQRIYLPGKIIKQSSYATDAGGMLPPA